VENGKVRLRSSRFVIGTAIDFVIRHLLFVIRFSSDQCRAL